MNAAQNFMILGTYKLHNAENDRMLSLCYYVYSYSPESATNMCTFYLHYSSFTFSYFFYIETVHSFFAFITKFLLYAKIRLVLLCGSIYQYFIFFTNSYLFYLVLLLKITLFNTVHCDGKNLTRL